MKFLIFQFVQKTDFNAHKGGIAAQFISEESVETTDVSGGHIVLNFRV